MANAYVIYETATGLIRSYGRYYPEQEIPDSDPPEFVGGLSFIDVPSGCAVMDTGDTEYPDRFHYVNVSGTPTVTAKVSLDTVATLSGHTTWTANGTSTVTYGNGLPSGTDVNITSSEPAFGPPITGTINDGVFQFNTVVPGVYTVEFTKFPWINQTLTLTAGAA